MPYLTQSEREIYDDAIREIVERMPDVEDYPGDLNYVVTRLCLGLLYDLPQSRPKLNYQKLNAVVGALEAAKLEIYRRHVAPYEDMKMLDHGDVTSPGGRTAGSRLAGGDD